MLSKRKIGAAFFSSLIGTLAVTTIAGVALTSCCTYRDSLSDSRRSIDENKNNDLKSSVKINWNDQSTLKNLTVDDQGLVYKDKNKTELVAISSKVKSSSIVIPASVKLITGYINITPSANSQKNSETSVSGSYYGAFQRNNHLTVINFENNSTLISIGASAFKECFKLISIALPSTVTRIGNGAFMNCIKLTNINLNGNSRLFSIGVSAFAGTHSMKSFVFPRPLSYIGAGAFSATPGVNSRGEPQAIKSGLVFANLSSTQLTSISEDTFSGAVDLSIVKLPSALTTIGTNAFKDCSSLSSLNFGVYTPPIISNGNEQENIANFDNASSLTTIGNNAFANTGFSFVNLERAIKLRCLSSGCFFGSKYLSSVRFPPTLLSWELGDPSDYSTSPLGTISDFSVSEEQPKLKEEEKKEEEKKENEEEEEEDEDEEDGEEEDEEDQEEEEEEEKKKKNGEENGKKNNKNGESEVSEQDSKLLNKNKTSSSNLGTIEFANFTLNDDGRGFSRIGTNTWQQIVNVMNMFSDQDDNKPAINSWLDANNLLDINKKWYNPPTGYNWPVMDVANISLTNPFELTYSTKKAIMTHKGVVWHYLVEDDGSVVIFGLVNVYKATNNDKNYGVAFNSAIDGKQDRIGKINPGSKTIVTLKIVNSKSK